MTAAGAPLAGAPRGPEPRPSTPGSRRRRLAPRGRARSRPRSPPTPAPPFSRYTVAELAGVAGDVALAGEARTRARALLARTNPYHSELQNR